MKHKSVASLVAGFFLLNCHYDWLTESAFAGEVQVIELSAASGHLVNPNTILIHNAAGQDIVFYLAPDNEQLKPLRLGNKESKLFSDGDATRYVINIPTEGRASVKYLLHGSRRYEIYWNGERWDVSELVAK